MSPTTLPLWLKINDIPLATGLGGRSRIFNLIAKKKLKAKKVGRTTLVETRSILTFIESQPDCDIGHHVNPCEKKAVA